MPCHTHDAHDTTRMATRQGGRGSRPAMITTLPSINQPHKKWLTGRPIIVDLRWTSALVGWLKGEHRGYKFDDSGCG